MVARNWLYEKGIFKIEHVNVPVISIGNITAGGTGKTPFAEYAARYLSSKGKRVAIVSRGYRRSSTGTHIVSDGRTIEGTALTGGDEPYQMAKKLSGVIVVVDEDRVRGARIAIGRFHPDVIVLDDGFQHRCLHRDLDIVLIDSTGDVSEIPLLPAGTRREPLSSLRRADVIACTRVEDALPSWMGKLEEYSDSEVIAVRFEPKRCRNISSLQTVAIDTLAGKKCLGFCGIGNPESFRKTLAGMGLDVVDFIRYPDHHPYSLHDFDQLHSRLGKSKAEIVVTTEKDASRFSSSPPPDFFLSNACYALEIEAVVTHGAARLHDSMDAIFARAA